SHCHRGPPYVHQGEELGVTNAGFTDISQYKDVESLNHFRILQEKGLTEENAYQILQIHSRDNSRTPMQWTSVENGGFTTGEPWLQANKNCSYINPEAELQDEHSIFHYYRKLIEVEKKYDVIGYEDRNPLDEKNPPVSAYGREYQGEQKMVICNFYGKNTIWESGTELGEYKCVLGNYEDQSRVDS